MNCMSCTCHVSAFTKDLKFGPSKAYLSCCCCYCRWTGRPGVLWFMGLQRVEHDWASELSWTELNSFSENLNSITQLLDSLAGILQTQFLCLSVPWGHHFEWVISMWGKTRCIYYYTMWSSLFTTKKTHDFLFVVFIFMYVYKSVWFLNFTFFILNCDFLLLLVSCLYQSPYLVF